MRTIAQIAKKTQKIASDNSPAILTAIGVTGTITTAYLTGKASFRAAKVISDVQFKENISKNDGERHVLDTKERAKLVWKLYIPAAGTGLLTIGCIVGANYVGTRRAAALAAAYSISERAFVEYKEKVIEKIGENKEREVRDELAQDRVNRHPPVEGAVIITGHGDVLCKDEMTGRYFRSNMDKLNRAQNDINFQILHSDYATVNNYYTNIGLEKTGVGDVMGWNSDKRLELHTSATLVEYEGIEQPCMVVDFGTVPIRDPWQFR